MNTVQARVIDDDDIDAMAIKRSFENLKFAHPVPVARNGLTGLETRRSVGESFLDATRMLDASRRVVELPS